MADGSGKQHKTLADVARSCLDGAGGDRAKAATALRKVIERNSGLRNELTAPLLDSACWNQIRLAAQKDRVPYWSAVSHVAKKDDTTGLKAVAEQHAMDWLSYPLSSGRRLGDANHDEIVDEAIMHESHARSNAIRAAFYRKVAELVTGDKCVRDVLTNETLETLAGDANHA